MQPQANPSRVPTTDRERYALDATRRWPTRHRGISYRLGRDLTRSYSIYWQGKFVVVGSSLEDTLVKQGDLRKAQARGEKAPPAPSKLPLFSELAGEWFAAKSTRLRRRTSDDYRSALDLVLLPRFGGWRIAAIDADAIASLIRDLEQKGIHAVDPKRKVRPLGQAAVKNYCKPLQGVMALAVRRGYISGDPFDRLTEDERPKREAKAPAHEWTDEDVQALLNASLSVAGKRDAKYDYTPLLRLVATLGLRQGEALGLKWVDFDKDEGVLNVARQWTRYGEYAPPKTRAGVRRIALPADLRDELIALRLRSRHSGDDQPIFASRKGTPLGHRNVTKRGFEPARDLAGLPASLTFHDLRHASVSRLIRAGLDPVTVANVHGHSDPHVTLRVYASMFNRQRTDEAVRLALAGGAS